MNTNYYTAVCRGTLGELYQGPFFRKNGVDISIISALSNNTTKAIFREGDQCNLIELGKIKVKKSLAIFSQKIAERKIAGNWYFQSDMLVGAGMSSSTSDIISALRCASQALNIHLTLEDITTCLMGVERSDTVFIDVPCLYLSQQQKIIDIYKPLSKIYCIYGLESKKIETSKTYDTLIPYYNDEKKHYIPLSEEVRSAFMSGNAKQIISASTKSATLSQGIYPKESFRLFMKNMKKFKSDGLIVAHTGSLVGFLYTTPPDEKKLIATKNLIQEQGLDSFYGEIF